jgi:N-acetylneuraminic acid mutarotase
MKKILLVVSVFTTISLGAQNWKWVRGSDTSLVPGTYGTMGVPSPLNDPGGRHGCATWTDKSGNLWLFGGEGSSTNTTLCWLNDLWKYDKTNNEWTWIRGSNGPNSSGSYGTMGVSSPSNDPPAREFATAWTDTAGNFWMFGGDAYDASTTSARQGGDLWKYDPLTNQWTWMKGFNTFDQYGVYNTLGSPNPSSLPGCRNGAAAWVDAANQLWLFGGRGWGSSGSVGYLNDLWRYDPSSNQWTWIKGSNLVTQVGTYGTMSVPNAANQPGGRAFPGIWRVANGTVYMFGGAGHASNTFQAYLSDFWKYEPSTNNWTWIGGPNTGNLNGNFGTMGQPSSAVNPGSRFSPASWVDITGKLWLFGGFGYPGQGSHGNLNDLLRYDISTGLWTLYKGDTTTNRPGLYGTMGTFAPSNKPGGRHYNTWWNNTGSSLWLFGGLGRDKDSTKIENMNDLWVFGAPCNPDSGITSSPAICSGNSASLTLQSPDNSAVTWYSTATTTVALATGSVLVTPPLSSGSATTVTYYASAATCSASARTAVTLTVLPLPQLSFLNSPASACAGQVVTLTVTGAQTYSWSSGSNATAITLTATVPGYTAVVIATSPEGCENSASHTLIVHPQPTVSAAPSSTMECRGVTVTFSAQGAQSYSWSSGQNVPSFTVNNLPYATHHFTVTGFDANGCSATATLSFVSSECPGFAEHQDRKFRLYPNPVTDHVILDPPPAHETVYTFFDALGKEVLRKTLEAGRSRISIDLPQGLYFVRIGSGQVARIIVR